MNLLELLTNDIKEDKGNIYLSIPFDKSSIVSFITQKEFEFFLTIEELKKIRYIYITHKINYEKMCEYMIYYVQNNIRHNDDIIKNKLNFSELIKNLDNYADYDFIFTKDIVQKNSELFILRVHPNKYSIPSDMIDFMELDLVKHLVKMYHNESLDEKIEKILYFYNNLSYANMNDLTISQLIENLENFYPQISFNITEYSHNALVKIIWYPWYERVIQRKAIEIEDKLYKDGLRPFNNTAILSAWKEDYTEYLHQYNIEATSILLSYLLLYGHIFDHGPSDDWVEKLLTYLNQDSNGNTIPKNIFDS